MGIPTVTVELATADGANPSTWTDISGYVTGVVVHRGRDDFFTQVQPGSATVTLDNSDYRFSPDLTTSPLYGHVVEMRAVRIRTTWLTVTRTHFLGYIQTIVPEPRKDSQRCTLTLADGSAWLQLAVTTPSYTNALSGTSIGTALTAASWPAGLRLLDAGQSTFTPAYTDQDTLTQCNGIAVDNEAGLFLFNASGSAWFQDRYYRLSSDRLVSQATFTGTMIDLNAQRVANDIKNQIKVTYAAGGTVTRDDTTSQTAKGLRRLDITASFIAQPEATSRADWTLSQTKDGHTRPVVSLIGSTNTLTTQILAREISDRITVTETTRTGLNTDYFIEALSLTLLPGLPPSCAWQLSPVDAATYWVLDTSQLGLGTTLAY